MEMPSDDRFVEELKKWEEGPRGNHWVHNSGLSIRSTHPHFDDNGEVHIAPHDGWVVEIYPIGAWPFDMDGADIYRWYPEDTENAIRTVKSLIVIVSILETLK